MLQLCRVNEVWSCGFTSQDADDEADGEPDHAAAAAAGGKEDDQL